MRTTYKGIDYGLGRTNIDKETGIRFGVISQGTVGAAWYDNAEGVYGDPTCPKCGNKVVERHTVTTQLENGVSIEVDDEAREKYELRHEHTFGEYACDHCQLLLGSDEVWPADPQGFKYEDKDYKLTDCLDSDIFVLKSPYFTYGQYCSPCVPGAVNLDSAIDEDTEDCPKGYCLGHDWFEDGKAPYKVYSVETGELVTA